MKYLLLFLPLVMLDHCKAREAEETAIVPTAERSSVAPRPSTRAPRASASGEAASVALTELDAPRTASEPGSCEVMCDHTRALGCTALSECARSCAALLAEQPCHEQLLRALRCMTAEPRAHWVCGEDGLAAIDSGYCDAEQRAFVSCVQQQAS